VNIFWEHIVPTHAVKWYVDWVVGLSFPVEVLKFYF